MPFRVLMVCGGNTCRSPMAQALLAHLARRAGYSDRGIVAESAGVSALDGQSASSNAVTAMAEMGIDISGYRSRRLRPEMIDEADLVLAMEGHHLDAVLRMRPDAAGKARKLADFDIADPFMMSVDVYRRTRDQIAEALKKVLDGLDLQADRGVCD